MYKVTYLKDVIYFDTFDELKNYFWKHKYIRRFDRFSIHGL